MIGMLLVIAAASTASSRRSTVDVLQDRRICVATASACCSSSTPLGPRSAALGCGRQERGSLVQAQAVARYRVAPEEETLADLVAEVLAAVERLAPLGVLQAWRRAEVEQLSAAASSPEMAARGAASSGGRCGSRAPRATASSNARVASGASSVRRAARAARRGHLGRRARLRRGRARGLGAAHLAKARRCAVIDDQPRGPAGRPRSPPDAPSPARLRQAGREVAAVASTTGGSTAASAGSR